MDLSVVIVTYNTKELLGKCLKSLSAATKSISCEIFVVDNNSWDQTATFVKKNFPKVKLISNKKNIGFAKANNLAIKKAKGKYILILNPDTVVLPETLKKMISFMEKNPKVGISTCKVVFPDGRLDKDCRRHFPNPWRAFCHFTGLGEIFPKSKIFDQYYMGYLPETKEHEVDACAGAFMMTRGQDLKKIGGFDEDFFFYGEDIDLCWRFKEKSFKIIYTPRTKIVHYKGVSSGIKKVSQELTKATIESRKLALAESTRAMRLFYKKHYQHKYPFFINWAVTASIELLSAVRQTRKII